MTGDALEAVMGNATHFPVALHSALERWRLQPELTPKEGEVLALVAQGLTTKEIARVLDVEPHTVDSRRGNIKQRFHLASGAALLRFTRQHNGK